jgi:hypothetical protein
MMRHGKTPSLSPRLHATGIAAAASDGRERVALMRLGFLLPMMSIVSFSLAFSVVWWSSQRRREREAYYRYELARLMLDRYADGQERVMGWLREQDAADAQKRREAMRLTAWVLLAGGFATLTGFRFALKDDALFGWVPVGVAVGLFLYLIVSVKSAASTKT